MADDTTYIPSQLLPGAPAVLRERAFTRWMTRDLLQAATDFCRNIGLVSIYSEVSLQGSTRYLFWHPPDDAYFEVRSGRPLDKFKIFDQANIEKGWPLLSLHIGETAIYSGVWVSADHYDAATFVLAQFGITPARRVLPGEK